MSKPDLKLLSKVERQLKSKSVREQTIATYLQAAIMDKPSLLSAKAELEIADVCAKRLPSLIGWADIKLDGQNAFSAYLVQTGTGALVTGLDGKPIRRSTLEKRFTQEVSHPTIKQVIEKHEKNIPHMYLDTGKNMTIGVGFLYWDTQKGKNEAKKIKFRFKDDASYQKRGRKSRTDVTDQDILDDWNAILKLAGPGPNPNLLASAYERVTVLRAEQSWITNEFQRRFQDARTQANSKFTLATLPPDIQIALVDLIYQIGIGTFDSTYKDLRKAMNLRDWETAGKEMNPITNSNRHKDRMALGRKAASKDPYFHRPSVKSVPLHALLGK